MDKPEQTGNQICRRENTGRFRHSKRARPAPRCRGALGLHQKRNQILLRSSPGRDNPDPANNACSQVRRLRRYGSITRGAFNVLRYRGAVPCQGLQPSSAYLCRGAYAGWVDWSGPGANRRRPAPVTVKNVHAIRL